MKIVLLPNQSFAIFRAFLLVHSELLKTRQSVENLKTMVQQAMPIQGQRMFFVFVVELRLAPFADLFVAVRVIIVFQSDIVRAGMNEIHEEIVTTSGTHV